MSPPMPNHRSEVLSVLRPLGFDLGGWSSSIRDVLPSGTNSESAIIFGTSGSWVDSSTSGFGVDLINFPFVVHSGP